MRFVRSEHSSVDRCGRCQTEPVLFAHDRQLQVGSSVIASLAGDPHPPNERIRHGGDMPSKDRPLVDRHAPKNGVGCLLNEQEGKVCRFTNVMLTQNA